MRGGEATRRERGVRGEVERDLALARHRYRVEGSVGVHGE